MIARTSAISSYALPRHQLGSRVIFSARLSLSSFNMSRLIKIRFHYSHLREIIIGRRLYNPWFDAVPKIHTENRHLWRTGNTLMNQNTTVVLLQEHVEFMLRNMLAN